MIWYAENMKIWLLEDLIDNYKVMKERNSKKSIKFHHPTHQTHNRNNEWMMMPPHTP